MKPLRYISLLSIFLSALISCKKDHQSPSTSPQPVVKNLSILMDTNYISGKQVDSVLVSWTVNGQKQIVNLQIKGDTLVGSLADLTPGSGELDIQLYSNRKFVYFSSLWLAKKQLSIKTTEAVNLKGPTGFNDLDWLPRVLLFNSTMKMDAIVGLRPTDPYFFVRNAEKNAMEIWFSREYWKTKGGLQKAAGGVWECKNGCLNTDGNILNEEFFKFLPVAMGSRPYDHIEIVLRYLMDKHGGGYSLDMNYTFPS